MGACKSSADVVKRTPHKMVMPLKMWGFDRPVVTLPQSGSNRVTMKDNLNPTRRSYRIAKMKSPTSPKDSGVERGG